MRNIGIIASIAALLGIGSGAAPAPKTPESRRTEFEQRQAGIMKKRKAKKNRGAFTCYGHFIK